MSKCYTADIYIGEEVRLPDRILVSGSSSHLLSTRCIGRNKSGLLFELTFQPAFGTEEPDKWCYKTFISYSAIYCGAIHIIRKDGTQVKAQRTVEGVRA